MPIRYKTHAHICLNVCYEKVSARLGRKSLLLKRTRVLVKRFQHCLEVLRFEEKKQQPESYYAEA
jgi:hypothetical protein